MKAIYIDCSMGAAGDMLAAALLELHPSPEEFISRINALGIDGVRIEACKSEKCGVTGTHISVTYHGDTEDDSFHRHSHHHMSISEIFSVIEKLELSERVKNDVNSIFNTLALAESKVHGTTVDNIHFHELGTMDAITDIICVCELMAELNPDSVYASPVNVGGGHVQCAHGVLPVPAPAVSEILKGVPIYSGEIKSELCTPTGAVLLKHYVNEYIDMPEIIVDKIGYGMGTKDFRIANCVRVYCGEIRDKKEHIYILSCNLDDMTGEEIGFACGRLFKSGALDVYTIPVQMKKSRPGVILQCICDCSAKDAVVKAMFKYTSTLGIRVEYCLRYAMNREIIKRETEYGSIRIKRAKGWGIEREKAEYDDVSDVAASCGATISEIKNNL